ncbi:MAG: hypothetical protein AB4372_15260 [Xenococcus sp. (in: cyanobacteria)]
MNNVSVSFNVAISSFQVVLPGLQAVRLRQAGNATASWKNLFWLEKTKSIQSKALRDLCQAVRAKPVATSDRLKGQKI